MTARIRSTLTAPLLVLALVLSALTATTPANDGAPTRVLLAADGAVDAAAAAVVELGGVVVDRFDGLGVLLADVSDVDALEADARVSMVTVDRAIAPQARGGEHGAPGRLAPPSTTAPASIRADEAWAAGITGEGVGIAVIDTGVDRTDVTRDALIASIATSGGTDVQDGFGHGTFVAALAAGAPDARTGFSGVAPDAHLVSIRVADDRGDATLGSVMAGLATADAAREHLGVRVVLLAAGGPDLEGVDLLELVLRQLWARGLVVVVPSGNMPGTVASPGVDPYLLTVGAIDDRGTADTSDDETVAWSGSDGGSKPDVLAPGVSVVSARARGSQIDREHPGSRIRGHHFRGSGTSMAAGITAGAVALLLQAEPDLTPDEVKGRMMAARTGDLGSLDVAAAIATPAPAANTELDPIELWESDPDAEIPSWLGNSWVGNSWIGNSWIGNSWVGNSWVGNSWVGNSWVGNSWVGNSWVGNSWVGNSWVGNSWVGNSWVGNSWVGNSWVGNSWVGNSWVGNSWVGNSWVGNSWVGNSWVGNSWVGNSWVGNSWVGNSWVGNSWVGNSWSSAGWDTPRVKAPRPGHVRPDGNSWV